MEQVKESKIRKFILTQILFGFATFLCCYQGVLRSYNSTMLALSYRYGFTSRSLLGTIYHFLDDVLPIHMMDYGNAFRFAQICTGLFFLFLIWFSYIALKKCREDCLEMCEILLFLFNLCAISTFSCGYNFLRVDLFMMLMALLSVLLLTEKRAEWLVLPLSALGVMFHQGFVFMYFNLALVLLLYRILTEEKKGKYFAIFISTFLIGSALFLWFELFSRGQGYEILDSVIADAKAVSFEGKYHSTLLAHEVLGIDLATEEWEWHKMNIVQVVPYVALLLPYLLILFRFFLELLRGAGSKGDKFKYAVVAIGSLTMLPDYVLKIDFGRWVVATITYYLIILVALVMLGDTLVVETLKNTYQRMKKRSWSFLLLVYPILFLPFWDVDINGFMQKLAAWLNGNLLHWFQI